MVGKISTGVVNEIRAGSTNDLDFNLTKKHFPTFFFYYYFFIGIEMIIIFVLTKSLAGVCSLRTVFK